MTTGEVLNGWLTIILHERIPLGLDFKEGAYMVMDEWMNKWNTFQSGKTYQTTLLNALEKSNRKAANYLKMAFESW